MGVTTVQSIQILSTQVRRTLSFSCRPEELRAGHHQVGLVVEVLVGGSLHQDDHRVVEGAAADEPHGAGAAEDGEGLARLVLFPAERLTGGEVRGVQLAGPAQLHEVWVAVGCEAGGGSPLPPHTPTHRHLPQLEVSGEEERGEGAVPGLAPVLQGEQPGHLGHQDVAG